MKYEFVRGMRPALLIGRAGRHDLLRIDGEERVAWHSAVGLGFKIGAGLPCLVAEDGLVGEVLYTVVAVESCYGGNGKTWVCVQPVLLEHAAVYFLVNGGMSRITGEYGHVARSPETGKCRLDFDNGSVYVEVCTSAAESEKTFCWAGVGILSSMDYFLNPSSRMQKDGKRIVCLSVCQHGIWRQTRVMPDRGATRSGILKAAERGVELWMAEIVMEADGISLLSYHNVADSILDW